MDAPGFLTRGARLPPIRRLAADLGLAPGTVARAYRELEQDGVIETRGRHGTLTREPCAGTGADTDRRLNEAARAFAVAALQLGLDRDRAVAAGRRAFAGLTR